MKKIQIVLNATKTNVSAMKILKEEKTKPIKVKRGSISLTNIIVKNAEREKFAISDAKKKSILLAYKQAEVENEKLSKSWEKSNPNIHWSQNPYRDGHKKMDNLKRKMEKLFVGYIASEYTFYGGGAIGIGLNSFNKLT